MTEHEIRAEAYATLADLRKAERERQANKRIQEGKFA